MVKFHKLIFGVILFFLFFNLCFAKIDIKQGELINEDAFSNIYIGMNKEEVLKNLGTPILVAPYNCDCLCYYFYFFSNKEVISIKRRYLVLFFEESLLISYFFRI